MASIPAAPIGLETHAPTQSTRRRNTAVETQAHAGKDGKVFPAFKSCRYTVHICMLGIRKTKAVPSRQIPGFNENHVQHATRSTRGGIPTVTPTYTLECAAIDQNALLGTCAIYHEVESRRPPFSDNVLDAHDCACANGLPRAPAPTSLASTHAPIVHPSVAPFFGSETHDSSSRMRPT